VKEHYFALAKFSFEVGVENSSTNDLPNCAMSILQWSFELL
jgi:hypothetical protein